MSDPRALRLHHLALGASDVERVAAFYVAVFGLVEVDRHHDERGVRSIWLEMGPRLVLMIERSLQARVHVEGVGSGPFLLAFHIEAAERETMERRLEAEGGIVESRTEFSSYSRDPEGNRVAVSSYPLPTAASSDFPESSYSRSEYEPGSVELELEPAELD